MSIGSPSPSTGRSGAGTDGSGTNDSSNPILELLVVFVVVFVLQRLTAIVGVMPGLFVLERPLTTNPWTIITSVTSVYAHGDIWHLLSNSIALVLFGWPVARATTRLRFHAFFAITGALAGVSEIVLSVLLALISTLLTALVPVIAIPVYTPTPGVLGASGAVFALMGYLLAGNRFSSGIASVVQLPQWAAWIAFVGLAILVTLATAAPRAALIAHFTGFLVGLLAGRARVLDVGSQRDTTRPTV